MKFLHRNRTESSPEQTAPGEGTASEEGPTSSSHTPKGHATPKRREAEGKRRGPVPPPPRTQREAAKRARGNKDERRKAAADRRERMMAGDDSVLMPRDRGPVRGYVRDVVDSRRHLMGAFMPLVLVVFVTTLIRDPVVQQYGTLACMVLLLTMLFEGTILGRAVNKRVRAKYPDAKDKPLSLGWYAFTRAMQIRKLRAPRPRVTPKDARNIG